MTTFSMKRSALALMVAGAVALAGCTAAKRPAPEGETPINPNPPAAEAPVESQRIVLYFSDWQAQHVIPEARHISGSVSAERLPTEVMKGLLEGPDDPNLNRTLPEGLRLLEDVKVEGNTAYVNLSEEITRMHGSAAVVMALSSIQYSLTELPGIERVEILVNGQANAEMDGGQLQTMEGRQIADYPVLVDEERIEHLQQKVAQGQETWRLDARETLVWEGRMFGFTEAELRAAGLQESGNEATATVVRGDKSYTVTMLRKSADGIWYMAEIEG